MCSTGLDTLPEMTEDVDLAHYGEGQAREAFFGVRRRVAGTEAAHQLGDRQGTGLCTLETAVDACTRCPAASTGLAGGDRLSARGRRIQKGAQRHSRRRLALEDPDEELRP